MPAVPASHIGPRRTEFESAKAQDQTGVRVESEVFMRLAGEPELILKYLQLLD